MVRPRAWFPGWEADTGPELLEQEDGAWPELRARLQ